MRQPRPKFCTVDGCGGSTLAKGFCASHYARSRTPKGVQPEIPLRRFGQAAKWLLAHVDHQGDDCLIWPRWRGGNGYGFVVASVVGSSKAVKSGQMNIVASRAMCILAHGDPPTDAHLAAHLCGNGHLGCVHPQHLRWATQAENMADKVLHGVRVGDDHLQIRAIQILAERMTAAEIASVFRVSVNTIDATLRSQAA